PFIGNGYLSYITSASADSSRTVTSGTGISNLTSVDTTGLATVEVVYTFINNSGSAILDISPSGNLSYTPDQEIETNLVVDAAQGLYTFNDTAEQIVLSGDAATLGWTGDGTNTVTGPVSSSARMNLFLSDQQSTVDLNATFCPTLVSD